MSTNHELKAMRIQMQQLEAKIELMKQLRTSEGFIRYFFKEIDNYKNRAECFNAVNELFYQLFGEYRYSDYDSFRRVCNHYKPRS